MSTRFYLFILILTGHHDHAQLGALVFFFSSTWSVEGIFISQKRYKYFIMFIRWLYPWTVGLCWDSKGYELWIGQKEKQFVFRGWKYLTKVSLFGPEAKKLFVLIRFSAKCLIPARVPDRKSGLDLVELIRLLITRSWARVCPNLNFQDQIWIYQFSRAHQWCPVWRRKMQHQQQAVRQKALPWHRAVEFRPVNWASGVFGLRLRSLPWGNKSGNGPRGYSSWRENCLLPSSNYKKRRKKVCFDCENTWLICWKTVWQCPRVTYRTQRKHRV